MTATLTLPDTDAVAACRAEAGYREQQYEDLMTGVITWRDICDELRGPDRTEAAFDIAWSELCEARAKLAEALAEQAAS